MAADSRPGGKNMKKFTAALTAFLFAFGCAGFAACTPQQSGNEVAATSVTLSETQLSLAVGESATLTATVLPEDATDKTVTWSSSDEGVVTVSGGAVTALAEGGATITATCGSVFAECAVTVTPAYGPVTAQEWTAAFDFGALDNFSLTAHVVSEEEGLDLDLIDYTAADGRERLVSRVSGEMLAYSEKMDETSEYAYMTYLQNGGPWIVGGGNTSAYEKFVSGAVLSVLNPVITGYEMFADSYDEAQGCYTGSLTMDEQAVDAVLRFAQGRLRSVGLYTEVGNYAMSYEFTLVYGGQSVQLPDERVDGQTWAAAFDFDACDNFQLTLVRGASPEEQADTQLFVYIAAEGKAYLNGNPNGTPMNAYAQRNADGAWQVHEQNATSSAWELTRTQEQSLYASDSGVKPLADALAAAFADFTYDEENLVYRGEAALEGTTYSFVVSIVGGRVVQVDWTEGTTAYSLGLDYGGQEVQLPDGIPEIIVSEQVSADMLKAAFDFDALDDFGMNMDIVLYDDGEMSNVSSSAISYLRSGGAAEWLYGTRYGSASKASSRTDDGWLVASYVGEEWQIDPVPQAQSLFVTDCGVAQIFAMMAEQTFTYGGGCYSADVTIDGVPMSVQAWFADGAIVRLSYTMPYTTGTAGQTVEYIFEFAYDSIIVPDLPVFPEE